jgi:hypothetical protein
MITLRGYRSRQVSEVAPISPSQDLPKRGFNPLSLRERARVRGLKNKAFFLIDPLIPTFSRREKEQNA